MPTHTIAKYYLDKLKRATVAFEAGNLDEARDVALQLLNGLRCPKIHQIEAWVLHAQCSPDNYCIAKSSLDTALETCVKCEAVTVKPGQVLDLVVAKIMVKDMMRDRLSQYREYWKAKGREPPTKKEWYEIADAQKTGEGKTQLKSVVGEDSGDPVAGLGKLFRFTITCSVRILTPAVSLTLSTLDA